MKKLSISTFVVLAIAFAVTSAFTSIKKASSAYAIYANQLPNSYLPTSCFDANFEQRDIPVSPKLYTQVGTQVSLYTKAQLDAFALAHCITVNPNRVCFVVLNIKDGVPDPAFATSPVVTASGAASCSIYYGGYFVGF